jgi:hypothetical protein
MACDRVMSRFTSCDPAALARRISCCTSEENCNEWLCFRTLVCTCAREHSGHACLLVSANAGQPTRPNRQEEWRGEVTLLSWRPRAFLYRGFLSDEECDHIIALVSRAGVVGPDSRGSDAMPYLRRHGRVLSGC